MKKFLIVIADYLLITVSAFAQTKTATGKITCVDTQQGISVVMILLEETDKG